MPEQYTQPTQPENQLENQEVNFRIISASVKFRGLTKPEMEEHPDIKTAEQTIAYHSRVSNPKNQANPNIKKLLQYCVDQGHWSIFEQAHISFEVVTSRDISAQLIKHNCKVQESSQRYAEVMEFLPIEARLLDLKNRQSSTEIDVTDSEQVELQRWLQEQYVRVLTLSMSAYQEALKRGIAKEVARKLLPINAKTTISATRNVRDVMFYIETRTKTSTQKEHRQIAEMIKAIFIQKFPIISKCKGWV